MDESVILGGGHVVVLVVGGVHLVDDELVGGDSRGGGVVEEVDAGVGVDGLGGVDARGGGGPAPLREALDDGVVDEHPEREVLPPEHGHVAAHDALDDVAGAGGARLVLAEVRGEAPVQALGDVEVDGRLLAEVAVGEDEQAEWPQRAPGGGAAAGAAVVADVGVVERHDGAAVEAELGLDVELRGAAQAEREDGAGVEGDAAEVGGVGAQRLHLVDGPLQQVGAGLGVEEHGARDALQRRPALGHVGALRVGLAHPAPEHAAALGRVVEGLGGVELAPVVAEAGADVAAVPVQRRPRVGGGVVPPQRVVVVAVVVHAGLHDVHDVVGHGAVLVHGVGHVDAPGGAPTSGGDGVEIDALPHAGALDAVQQAREQLEADEVPGAVTAMPAWPRSSLEPMTMRQAPSEGSSHAVWNPVRCHCSMALLQGNALPPASASAPSLPSSPLNQAAVPDVFSDTPASGPLLRGAVVVVIVVAAAAAAVVSPGPGTTVTGGRPPSMVTAATARSSAADRTSAAAQSGLPPRLLPPVPETSPEAVSAAGSGE
ncbi:LOW QUALITY PROTEIN: hypothetical protein U9M48_025995 [Paspalum notatum var. saurae]|uniref:Uncharacterized protein n=1 Tax=Paspalum notatum var. saurae TaxID=547442 RepID=A0AAQ3WXQ4_PASNO